MVTELECGHLFHQHCHDKSKDVFLDDDECPVCPPDVANYKNKKDKNGDNESMKSGFRSQKSNADGESRKSSSNKTVSELSLRTATSIEGMMRIKDRSENGSVTTKSSRYKVDSLKEKSNYE